MRATSRYINKFIPIAIDVCAVRFEIFDLKRLSSNVFVFAQIA